MSSSNNSMHEMAVEFGLMLEAMAELERRGETERVEEMHSMLTAVRPQKAPAAPRESRRDRRARERREAKALRRTSGN